MEPGTYSWPLQGETDDHMSRFYVSRTMTSPPADPECDDFVPVEQPAAEETQVGDGGARDGFEYVVLVVGAVAFTEEGGRAKRRIWRWVSV